MCFCISYNKSGQILLQDLRRIAESFRQSSHDCLDAVRRSRLLLEILLDHRASMVLIEIQAMLRGESREMQKVTAMYTALLDTLYRFTFSHLAYSCEQDEAELQARARHALGRIAAAQRLMEGLQSRAKTVPLSQKPSTWQEDICIAVGCLLLVASIALVKHQHTWQRFAALTGIFTTGLGLARKLARHCICRVGASGVLRPLGCLSRAIMPSYYQEAALKAALVDSTQSMLGACDSAHKIIKLAAAMNSEVSEGHYYLKAVLLFRPAYISAQRFKTRFQER